MDGWIDVGLTYKRLIIKMSSSSSSTASNNLAEYERRADELRRNTVAKNSRSIYLGSMVKFLIWMVNNKPSLVTEHLQAAIGSHSSTVDVKKSVKKYLV